MNYIKDLLSDTSAFGAIVTALISIFGSFLIAHFTAKNEIRKSEIVAKREDKLAEDTAFRQMVSVVTVYLSDTYFDNSQEALTSIAVARTYKTGYIAELMDELQDAISTGNRAIVKATLSKIIANNRNPDDI